MKRTLLIIGIMLASLIVLPVPTSAQMSADAAERAAQNCEDSGRAWDGSTGTCLSACGGGTFLGLPTWYRYLQTGERNGRCDIIGPSVGIEGVEELDWPRVIGFVAIALVEILLRVASLVAVGFVMYGGFNFITSQGDPEKAKSARQTVQNALIGLVIAIAAASIVAFVGNRLGD